MCRGTRGISDRIEQGNFGSKGVEGQNHSSTGHRCICEDPYVPRVDGVRGVDACHTETLGGRTESSGGRVRVDSTDDELQWSREEDEVGEVSRRSGEGP